MAQCPSPGAVVGAGAAVPEQRTGFDRSPTGPDGFGSSERRTEGARTAVDGLDRAGQGYPHPSENPLFVPAVFAGSPREVRPGFIGGLSDELRDNRGVREPDYYGSWDG